MMISALLYHHRADQHRVEVIDLDPYGTAAPFIDGAVQAVADGGESDRVEMTLAYGFGGRIVVCNVYGHGRFGEQQLS